MVENLCSACQLPILDRYLLHLLDKPFHTECIRCCDCSCTLDESCFFRDGLILCRADFERRFGVRCAACNLLLQSREMVRKARDNFYHCQCFRCATCQRLLDTGEQLYIVDGKFICSDDFMSNCQIVNSSEIFPNDDCSSDYDEELDENRACTTLSNESTNSGVEDAQKSNTDDGLTSIQKRRGPRTTIKAKQLEILKAAFASTPKPTRHMREQLAAETGLSNRVIQVWYQNRRSKERRLKQMRTNGTYRSSRRQRSSSSIPSDEFIGEMTTPIAGSDTVQYFPTVSANSIYVPPGSSDIYSNSTTPSSVNYWPLNFGGGFEAPNHFHRPEII